MSNDMGRPIRSPSYPGMSLREAVDSVGKIEAKYRSSPVGREVAAKLLGYSSLSGPATKALAALASYGLLERAGKGETRITERAKAILHSNDESEKVSNLRAAALEPSLFRELRDRFQGIPVPPEEGVVTYLNRQGFNPTAVRPAAKAFLNTMRYLEELKVTESYEARDLPEFEADARSIEEGVDGVKVGDLVQWESQGILRLPKPMRVRMISEDGKWVFVEGSSSGIPVAEAIVESRAPEVEQTYRASSSPPSRESVTVNEASSIEWMRNRVSQTTTVRILVDGHMGTKEIGKLIKLLEAQKLVLEDD